MKQTRIFFGMFLVSAAAFSWACSDDDASTGTGTTTDAGLDGDSAVATDATTSALTCGDAGGAPARALVVQGHFGKTTFGNSLFAVNLGTKAIDGQLAYDGGFGTVAADGTEPYLLDQTNDTVTRLDAMEPWKAVATWNVHGDDGVDGGDALANPVAVVTPSCSKAYVLRYNRDKIAVIDQSNPAGGVPTKYIDLSSLKQDGDPNQIDITSAVYVASKRRVYVLLGNVDFTLYNAEGNLDCPAKPLVPTVVAIDVDTDELVSLGGSGPGGGIALKGYNPVVSSPLVYDAAGDRLLVLNGGCEANGSIGRASVEEVALATGTTCTLLDISNESFPNNVAFVDANHAAIAFLSFTTGNYGHLWNPTQNSLGASIPVGVDIVATDGRGGFVASHATTDATGDAGIDIVTFPADGGAEVLVNDSPFRSGYVSGLASWPHP